MKTSKYQMKLAIFFLGVLFVIPSGIYSQDVEIEHFKSSDVKISCLYQNSVGLRYSNFSGYGLNYNRRFLGDFAVSLSGMAQYYEHQQWEDMSKSKVTSDKKDINLNFGIEFQRDLIISRNTRVYALLGGGYLKTDNRDMANGTNTYTYSAGLGFGLDWFLHERISGFFAIAYKYDNIIRESKSYPEEEKRTTIGVGVGLAFHF
jgi:hypothetical protein